jgi:hypothetical protein
MTTEDNTGAAKYRAKQRRFWVIVSAATLVFAAVGALIGGYAGYAEGMQEPVQNFISPSTAWALAALLLMGFWLFDYFYLTRADEVEVQHNLWANTAGLYCYLGVYIAWEVLHLLGAAPAVDGMTVFWLTLATTFGGYMARRYWPA